MSCRIGAPFACGIGCLGTGTGVPVVPLLYIENHLIKISFWLVTVLQSSFVDTGLLYRHFTQDKNKKEKMSVC